MGKKSRTKKLNRSVKKEKTTVDYNQVGLYILAFVGIVVGCKYFIDWIVTTLPAMPINYIRPAEINWNNGLPLLLCYCMAMIGLALSGYFMARKDEKIW